MKCNVLGPVIALIAFLAGCGGGSGAAPPLSASQPGGSAGGPSGAIMSTAHVVLTIPAQTVSSAAVRHPAFVSPSTQSVSVQIDTNVPVLQNVLATSPNCTSAGATAPINCTVTVTASVGSHTVSFVTYDQQNGAGNKLSANATAVTFVAGQNPAIPIILAGVPVTIHIDSLPGSTTSVPTNSLVSAPGLQLVFGIPQTVAITALDADGNFIVGPGAPTLSFSTSDTDGTPGVTVTPAGNGNANEFTLAAPSAGYTTLTVTATPQSGSTGSPVTFAYTIAAVAKVTTAVSDPTQWSYVHGLALDSNNTNLYTYTEKSCLVYQATLGGTVTSIAGTAANCYYSFPTSASYADGTGTAAEFGVFGLQGESMTFDSTDGNLYLADTANCSIRKITPAGVVTTIAGGMPPTPICNAFADGTGALARFGSISSIAYDAAADALFVGDNCAIRKVTASGIVTTIAGSVPPNATCGYSSGTGSSAKMGTPIAITYDSVDGNLYFIDHCGVRRMTPTGVVSTLTGGAITSRGCGFVDGIVGTAKLTGTVSIAFDSDNGMLYIGDSGHVRQVDPTTGTVVTIAGPPPGSPIIYTPPATDGIGSNVGIAPQNGLTYDHATGFLYSSDLYGIRQIQL